MATNPNDIAPTENPIGNGLINQPAPSTSSTSTVAPALPPLAPIPPIQSYTPAIGATGTSTGQGYAPTPYTVPEAGMVQKRVLDLVGEDSPLMQQARQRAMQDQNTRGLVNSSLAVTAGQDAVIKSALPIASADANAINVAAGKTSDALNMASQFGAGAANTASTTNAQLTSSMNATNAGAQNSALAAGAQAENVRNLSLIDANSKQALAVLDTQNRQLLQTNANASNMFQETVKNIAAISVNPSLTKAAKDAAIASQINLLNQGLQTTQNIAGTVPSAVQGLNLSQYFQTTTGSASFTPAQKATESANLATQISDLTAQRNDVAQNGTGVPVLVGPNASERRKPLWDAAVAELDRQIAALKTQQKALKPA